MFIQVQNSKLKRNNQFRVLTMSKAIKEAKSRGWNPQDCTYKELRDGLVKADYQGLDGRTNTRGKQFLNRKNKLNRVVSI